MDKGKWWDRSWNPVIGCSKISPGCKNCYAEKLAATRLKHLKAYSPLTTDGAWNGKIHEQVGILGAPLSWWKKGGEGRRVFVCDMGDLFHENVTFHYIAAVYGVMASRPDITFIVLTKRPDRMVAFMKWVMAHDHVAAMALCELEAYNLVDVDSPAEPRFPPRNVWHGTTVEDQQRANERIPWLLQVQSAVRFLSVEPLLEHIDFSRWLGGNNASEASRGKHTASHRSEMVRGTRRRFDMEDCSKTKVSLERDGEGQDSDTPSSRHTSGRRVQKCEVHGQRQAVQCPSTQGCVDVVPRSNSVTSACQPQERRQRGQSDRESGVGNAIRELSACCSCSEGGTGREPGRREESRGEVERRTGADNSRSLCERTTNASRTGGGVRGCAPADFENSQRAKKEKSARPDVGLHDEQTATSNGSGPERALHLLIIGGESGTNARQCKREHIEHIVRECKQVSIPPYVKQLGSRYIDELNGIGGRFCRPDESMVGKTRRLKEYAGRDMSEWPEILRIRMFPKASKER